jgi:hypothetical protein
MAKMIKKAQLGGLFKKGAKMLAKEVAQEAPKKVVKKNIPKISDDAMEKVTQKASREDLKAKMKVWDSEMKTSSSKKKMKNGGSLSGLNASTKRVGPVDPKGAYTKVQKKTLAGAKGKASLTKDKQLGATKMAKRGMSVKKK